MDLPKPEVRRATWDGSPGWSQYHDDRDPLPTEWDDEPPDVVEGFYSGETVREIVHLAVERALNKCWEQMEAAHIQNPTGNGWSDQLAQNNGVTLAQNILAAAIRKSP
jgi:hypothetical protein